MKSAKGRWVSKLLRCFGKLNVINEKCINHLLFFKAVLGKEGTEYRGGMISTGKLTFYHPVNN